jgi:RNA polymerase sigma factor for flagellar operon FliA
VIKAQGYTFDPQRLVEAQSNLVRKIAYHLMGRLPASVLVEDLIQSGMLGLLEAARNFDATKGASFETFAGIRIRGAMLDDLRKGDWVPRSVHRNSRSISNAISLVEGETGEDAQPIDIAKQLGVTLVKYQAMLNDVNCAKLVAYEDFANAEELLTQHKADENTVFDQVCEHEFSDQLVVMIKALPEKEALVLSLYYDEELNLKEIGSILEVSESRVSQILSQAIHRLKAKASR